MCSLLHLNHKGASPPSQFVGCTHPSENAIHNSYSSRTCRYWRSHLGNENNKSYLSENGGLSCHIGSRYDYNLLADIIEGNIIWNETALGLGRLHHGMASFLDGDFGSIFYVRPAVVPLIGNFGQGCEYVHLCYHGGGGLNTSGVTGNRGTECHEEFFLKLDSLLVRI